MATPTELGYRGNLSWLDDRTIFLTKHGSHAYGLNTPTSDLDIKGVAVPPSEYFWGFVNHFEQAESKEPDMAIYDIRKFFRLASEANPNIIEVLWTDPADHLIVTPAAELLLDLRADFLSQKVKHSFSGYACSQLKRISGHHRWLVNPPKAPPTRAEFGLPERTLIPQDQLAAARAMVQKKLDSWQLDMDGCDPAAVVYVQEQLDRVLTDWQLAKEDLWKLAARTVGLDDNLIHVMDQERAYQSAKASWDQYQTWVKTRNPARAELEAKYGIDTKHAMHLVRLLKMCREILETGKVVVKRPDREELLAIRNGAWSYEQLVDWAAKEDRALTEVLKTSKLPHAPDRKKLDAACMRISHRFVSSEV